MKDRPYLKHCVICHAEKPEQELMWWLIRGRARFAVCQHPSRCYDRVLAAEREARGSLSKLLNLLVEI